MFDIKKFNLITLFSIIILLVGIILYVYWVATYGVVYDIGIYSITIVLVLGGLLGILISLRDVKEETE
jgi:hypothetical protein